MNKTYNNRANKQNQLVNVLTHRNIGPAIRSQLGLKNRSSLYRASKELHNLNINFSNRSEFLHAMKSILNTSHNNLTINRAQKITNHLNRLQTNHTPANAQKKIYDSFAALLKSPWNLSNIYATEKIERVKKRINYDDMRHLSTALASGSLPNLT